MKEQEWEQLTWSPEDFLASPSPWLASKKEKRMTVTYGRKCSELSENLRRVGLSVRTYLESCELPLPTLSRTWSVKAITSSCLILKLRLSALSTGENESHLWATPNTMDHLPVRSPEALLRQATGSRKGRTMPANLREQVDEETMRLWPTPAARDYRGTNSMEHLTRNVPGKRNHERQPPNAVMLSLFPTPTTGAGLCGGTGNYQQLQTLKENGVITEEERRNMSQGNGGQLNPTWVEWLMGFPIGWTDLNA